jgi:hypothetical protein
MINSREPSLSRPVYSSTRFLDHSPTENKMVPTSRRDSNSSERYILKDLKDGLPWPLAWIICLHAIAHNLHVFPPISVSFLYIASRSWCPDSIRGAFGMSFLSFLNGGFNNISAESIHSLLLGAIKLIFNIHFINISRFLGPIHFHQGKMYAFSPFPQRRNILKPIPKKSLNILLFCFGGIVLVAGWRERASTAPSQERNLKVGSKQSISRPKT